MKFKKIITVLSSLMLMFALTACAADEKEETTAVATVETTAEVAAETTAEAPADTTAETTVEALPVFNAETLAEFNGKDGKAAYVAYEGKVYDVSNIAAWKTGIHQGRYEAGKDYTEVLNNDAPHKPTNLTDNAPIVGTYE